MNAVKLVLIGLLSMSYGLSFGAGNSGNSNFRAEKLETINKLYQPYKMGNGGSVETGKRLYSNDLKSVFREDELNTPDGEMGCMDYDPIVSAQDMDNDELRKTLKIKVLDNGRVEARFRLFPQAEEPETTVQFALQCTSKGCLIDDIFNENRETGEIYSFKKMIRQCISQQ